MAKKLTASTSRARLFIRIMFIFYCDSCLLVYYSLSTVVVNVIVIHTDINAYTDTVTHTIST